jgi:hypothetical protein
MTMTTARKTFTLIALAAVMNSSVPLRDPSASGDAIRARGFRVRP